MSYKKAKLALMSLAMVFSFELKAQYTRFQSLEYLGQTRIQNIFSDSDELHFGSCAGPNNDFITNIQLRVDRAPVEIEELVVQFGNGDLQHLTVRDVFQPGTTSRLIDLNGGARCVTGAYVRARTLGFFTQGIVSFYGLKSGPVNPPPFRKFIVGRTALDYNRDADRILVSRCDGINAVTAKQLQLHVEGSDANIEKFVVTFGNGDVLDIPIREIFKSGSVSRIVDLPGESRCIREIFILGRTLDNVVNNGKSIVDIYGYR